MSTYKAANDLAQQIQAETGLLAVTDSRNIHPPCVLIPPPRVEMNTFCGGNATFKLLIIVPGPWNADAWQAADDMLGKLLQCNALTIEDVQPDTYEVSENARASVYACTTNVAVSW